MNELNLLEEALNMATGQGVFKNMGHVTQIGHCLGALKQKLTQSDKDKKELEELRYIVAKQNEAAANKPGPSLIKEPSPIKHKGN